MNSALAVHRLHFAFTITFHYIFPQLTMGLALLIFVLKTIALRTGNEQYNSAARFWTKIFAVNFAMAGLTGIRWGFHFGRICPRFSRAAGGGVGKRWGLEGGSASFFKSHFWGLRCVGE